VLFYCQYLNAQGVICFFDLLHVCIGSDLYVDINQSIVLEVHSVAID